MMVDRRVSCSGLQVEVEGACHVPIQSLSQTLPSGVDLGTAVLADRQQPCSSPWSSRGTRAW
jgi:hypothetical protein